MPRILIWKMAEAEGRRAGSQCRGARPQRLNESRQPARLPLSRAVLEAASDPIPETSTTLPGDIDVTLNWLPDTELNVRIEDPASSHALISADNSSVRVLPIGEKWPLNEVRHVLKSS